MVEGLSQRKAYLKAYNCKNMKDVTIDNKASKLFAKSEVRIRYEELVEEHKEKALYKREQAVLDLIWLKDKARESIELMGLKQANGGHYLNAVKELCLLEDHYPTRNKKEDDKTEKQIAKVLKEAMEDI